MAVQEIAVESEGRRLGAWYLPAEDGSLAGEAGRPCVVMAHGFGATRDSGLLPFAEGFTAAGADVLLVDYRGFADSEGEPRRSVDHRTHRRDYHAAVARARLIDGVDPARIVLWGSSYAGGHVVAVAAEDPRIAGVISQGAAMDGLGAVLEILRYAGAGQLLRLTGHALRDTAGALLGRPVHRVGIYGPPGATAAITSPDAAPGYGAIVGPTFVNDMPARGILTIPFNRPVTAAPRVRCPMLLVVAADDAIAPPDAVRKVAATSGGRVEVLELDCGHFDIYVGEPFATSLERQIGFLRTL
ncbi:alpha/beta hydrolase [Actinomycetospora sp. TBRC 11914]|uniref:alpha/beta hydrolase n=1 Tax=Actinomycetospora sp. TBRC 11914 TaxID=2729387 RepID=UPI00145E563D|nr:alpha/beta fold hydrolase [Actinomycetospora sp. TBRC 11914]NMO90152.1 alpha/beta hydrolase [Actinomycetospora sp. TBRC 11914]